MGSAPRLWLLALAPRDIHLPSLRKAPEALSQADLDYVRARYDGEIAYTDRWVGKLLKELGEEGLEDTTLVFVTSDHGEELRDHDNLGHGKYDFHLLWRRCRAGLHGVLVYNDVVYFAAGRSSLIRASFILSAQQGLCRAVPATRLLAANPGGPLGAGDARTRFVSFGCGNSGKAPEGCGVHRTALGAS